ncbi:MAG: anti-sigma factor family protein [Edaphobacter sp.]
MTHTIQYAGHLQPDELSAFIDGELSAADSRDVQQHLEACHRCTLRVVVTTQLKAATARAGQRFALPPDALTRLSAQIHRQTTERSEQAACVVPVHTGFSRRFVAWSALAAAILLAVSLIGWRAMHQPNAFAAELLDQHLAVLSSGSTPQVISTDRHTVKPWFQGRLPFSFNLPESNALPPDTMLRGADLVYLGGQPAALLIFSIHKHQASVFLTRRTGGLDLTPRSTRSGFTVQSTTAAELRLTAVSDVNPAELDALVRDLAKVQ